MAEQGVIEVVGELKPGTAAKLVANYGGPFADHLQFGEAIAEATVGDDGRVRFEGLPINQRYWLVGEGYQQPVRGIGVTAKAVGVGSPYAGLEAPRGTLDSEPQEGAVLEDRPESGQPGPRQQDVPLDVVQRSDTPVGVATPIPAHERSPYPAQDEAEGVKASDTPEGQHVPASRVGRQDEVDDAELQRSSTEAGVATSIAADHEPLRVGDEPADPIEHDDVVPVTHVEERPLDAAVIPDEPEDLSDLSDEEVAQRQAEADGDGDKQPGEPWSGYDDAPADELKDTISRKRSADQLRAAIAFEKANKDRSTVVAAAEARLAELEG